MAHPALDDLPVVPAEIFDHIISELDVLEDYLTLSSCALTSRALCGTARRHRFQDLHFDFFFESPSAKPDGTHVRSFLHIVDASVAGMTQGHRLTPIPRLLRSLTVRFSYSPIRWDAAGRLPPIDGEDVVALLARMQGEDFGIQSFNFYLPFCLKDYLDCSWMSLSIPFKQAFWGIIDSPRLRHVSLRRIQHLPSTLFHSSPISHLGLFDVRFRTLEETQTNKALCCRDSDLGQHPLLKTVQLTTSDLPLPYQLELLPSGQPVFPYRTMERFLTGILTFEQIDSILQTNDGSLKDLVLCDSACSK